MIETKVKCDTHAYAYSYREHTGALLDEALKSGWYEIEAYDGAIKIKKPLTVEDFNPNAKHACCAEHARKLVEEFAEEMITDPEPEPVPPPAPVVANQPESDIPF
jgi:hypothetical protein